MVSTDCGLCPAATGSIQSSIPITSKLAADKALANLFSVRCPKKAVPREFWWAHVRTKKGAGRLTECLPRLRRLAGPYGLVRARLFAKPAKHVDPIRAHVGPLALDTKLPFGAWHAAYSCLYRYAGKPKPEVFASLVVKPEQRAAHTKALAEWLKG